MSLEETYNQFESAKRSGLKSEAGQIADELIREYRTRPDPKFVYSICDRCQHKIDYRIWRELVLPTLTIDISSNPKSIRGMIQTIQNLYASKPDWEALDWVTEEQLTRRLLAICPEDPWAREKLLECLRRWLADTIHEWPSGVLYGPNGATPEQCDEIVEATDELRRLDLSGQHAELCDEVVAKTTQYKLRLAN